MPRQKKILSKIRKKFEEAEALPIKPIKEEKTLEKMQEIMPLFHSRLEKFRDRPNIGDVRYIGLIGALELVKDKKTREGFPAAERIGLKVYKEGLARNLILRPLGNIIYLFLPLCVKKDELEDILERFEQLWKKGILS